MRALLFLVVLSTGGLLAWGQTRAEDVKSFTLSNGMKFLVVEDHSIPNANLYLFWRVGSRNERPGITGISHFFEHMMFNGAKKYGPKEFDRVMEANGGSNNAYTTADVTVYTDWFQSGALETIFDLEADRIANLAIAPSMVESERGVVLSERSTGLENSNFRTLFEQVQAAAFTAHPYHWPVIGYESDIKAWTQADLEAYHRTYYSPNNGLAVVVGDVTLAQVEALARTYIEPIPAQPAPEPVRTVEPEQFGERRITVYKDIYSPNLAMAWHVPATRHPDFYALDLLSSLLTGGESARLTKGLVYDRQVATSVFAFGDQNFDPGLFSVYAVASSTLPNSETPVTPQLLEAAIDSLLADIRQNGVTERELQKVKNQKLIEFYRSVEDINGRANALGTYELFFGDYRKLYDAPSLYQQVTVDDIRRVAATYLVPTNRTVGYLLPTPTTQN